jgi:hypothetical protein
VAQDFWARLKQLQSFSRGYKKLSKAFEWLRRKVALANEFYE